MERISFEDSEQGKWRSVLIDLAKTYVGSIILEIEAAQGGEISQTTTDGVTYGHAPTMAHGCVLPDFTLICELYTLINDTHTAQACKNKAMRLRQQLRKLMNQEGLMQGGYYESGKIASETSVHAQTLSLLTGLASQNQEAQMIDRVLLPYVRGELETEIQPSAYWVTYVYSILSERGYGAEVIADIRKRWTPMIAHGTTWEKFHPIIAKDSYSHAWSAHPLYHCMQIIGGVKQTAPEWKEVSIQPSFCGDSVETCIPSPQGKIESRWKRSEGRIDGQIKLPKGVVFDKCYTPDAPCLPSRTAFYSGRFGIQTGVVGHGGTAAQPKIEGATRGFRDHFDWKGLGGRLQRCGYHTAMISPFGQRHAAWHFYAGFNEIHNTGQGGMESAEVVQPVVDQWMSDHAKKDKWYLHINYWDPHTPYRTPADYENIFADEPLPDWLSDEVIEANMQKVGPHCAHEINMYTDKKNPKFPKHPGKATTPEEVRQVIDGYDLGVRYVDDQIAKIVADLKAAGVYDDTMIIISADHGENLGELGLYGEHGTADDITCRVPLIIKYPGGAQGIHNTKFHYNLDLAPTLMDLLDGRKQELWDGESYAEAITEGADIGRDEVTMSQCCHVAQRSVRWDRWLYTRTYHCGFHLFPQEMLFDLEADPHEQNNLAAEKPELCQQGQWRLSRWHDAQMQKIALTSNDVVDPLWTVIKEGGPFHASLTCGSPGRAGFDQYMEYLEATDRKEGAEALRDKYTKELKHFNS